MPPDRQGHHHSVVGFENDPRDRSSSQEWDEAHPLLLDDCRSLSSQKSDAGYHSSGAMSDWAINHAAAASSSSFDHGCYNPMSSMRSVGSTGSQGSGRGYGHVLASHLVNGETRFPTATSYVSDAQRSDVATVCSGSVAEDIEVESVISVDLNVQASSNNPTSPPSSVKLTVGACSSSAVNSRASNTFLNDPSNPSATSNPDLRIETVVPPQKGLPVQALGNNHATASYQQQTDPRLALHNNMGPPLSRGLLLQQHPQHHHHHAEGNSSQAGSVKSFESNAGSDVVAHVDTDDCGGSLDMDVHSIHSQEDVANTEGTDAAKANRPSNANDEADGDTNKQSVNPLLCSSESNANGRTSPGGTIYKGRGNRRYQGRYMHLPLKRFHQNGVDLGEDHSPPSNGEDEESCRNHFAAQAPSPPPPQQSNGGWCNGIRDRSRSPDNRHHPRDRSPRDRRLLNGSRPRSRSRSRSRSRERDRDRNPPSNYDAYDNRKPRARRWQQQQQQQHGGSADPSSSSGNSNNHYRGGGGGGGGHRAWGDRNGYNDNHNDYGSNRGPCRNRNRRR